MKYIYLTLFSFFLSFSSFAIAPITGKTTVCKGSTDTLADATAGGTWASSSALIATVGVSTGIVTGVFPGTAIITYSAAGARATVTVTVNPTGPISGNTTICVGVSTTISDAIFGGTWSISNTVTATLVSGTTFATVTGLKAGFDTAIYTFSTGCTVPAVITINPLPTAIIGKPEVCVGSKISLSDASYSGSWTSSNPSIATVGLLSGSVTGMAGGGSYITYTLPTSCYAVASLTVDPLPAPITGYNYVFQGNQITLADATAGGVWSSNYPSVASIDPVSGVVTGISSEVAIITYKLPTTGCAIYSKVYVNPFPDSAAAYPVVAWYPFCGDMTDHTFHGNNLTTPAAPPGTFTVPTLIKDRFGNANNAYSFDGVKNEAEHAFFPTTTGSGDFTYACWVKYDVTTTPQTSVILYNGNPAANGCGFVINDGTGPMGPGFNIGVYLGGVGQFLNQPLPGAGWTHLCLVKKSNNFYFYVNNAPAGFFPSAFAPPSGKFMLGQNAAIGSGVRKYTGDLDDVAIFNTALTDLQRTELYMFNPDAVTFSLGPDRTICSDTVTLSPDAQFIGYNYVWSTKDTSDTTIVVSPPALPPPSGTTYTLDISKPYGCDASSSINIYKNPLPINLGIDTNICQGDTIILSATYKLGKYLWNTGDTTPTIKVFSTANYFVTVDSSICVGHDTIFVDARVTPKVDLGPDIFSCYGAPAHLKNSYDYYDTGMTYLWSSGSNLDSLVTNTSGNFWLQVTNKGCSRADSITTLIVFDTFSFYSRDTSICFGRFVTGSASFNPIVSYQWTPTTGVPLSKVPSPLITPDTSAWYILTGSYPGCPDQKDSFYIDVQPNPLVFLGGNRKVCQFDTVNITASVMPNWYNKYIFKWTPSTFLDDPTLQTVIFRAGDSTKLFVNVTTTAGCTGSDSAFVVVYPGNFDSAFADIHVCPGDSVHLVPNMYYADVLYGTIASYQWHPGIYFTDSTSSAPWLHAITSQSFTTIGTSQYGCLDTFRFNVKVEPGGVLYLGDSVTLHPGETYHIASQTNCVYFSWWPPVGLSDSNGADPIAAPTTSTNYIVHGMTQAGCKVVDSINVRIDPTTLLGVPNAFTPGAGINNILKIIKRGMATLNHFRIYNRWGNLVYETTNIDAGWDGNFNGKPQPFGVYIYEVDATTNTGKKFLQQGNVTLIR